MTEPAKPPRPASTILLLRDATERKEIEVFMMVRHYEIDFNSGALVFPGGSVDKGDKEIIARSELYSGGEGLDEATLSFRIAAICSGLTSTPVASVKPFPCNHQTMPPLPQPTSSIGADRSAGSRRPHCRSNMGTRASNWASDAAPLRGATCALWY